MNFIKLYIGDYLRDTGTLTLAQHGAYALMLLEFYATEKPLPQGRELHRLLRADSKAERDAIDFIAGKFWTATDAGLTNARAIKEIERAANQRAINQEIGKRGGRPKRTERRTEPETDSVSEPEPNRNPNHSQTPEIPPVVPRGGTDTPSVPCPYDRIVGLYHAALPSLPHVRLMPAARQKAMRKVWAWVLTSTRPDNSRRATNADEALQWFADYFARAADNDFLMGRTPRSAEHAGWQCDLDYLLTERGMKQVIEKTKDAA